MTKELKALENIKKYYPFKIGELEYQNIDIVEAALKEKETPTETFEQFVGEPSEVIYKKLKVLEIIKEKGVNVGVFLNRIKKDIDYKEYKRLCGLYKIMTFSEKDLVKEEYELLKEVLL